MSCDGATAMCVSTDVPDGTPTPGVTQTPGDCHVHLCVGGMDVDVEDDSDVPAVPTAIAGCADALCTAGVPSNPLHALDSVCSTFMGNQPGACDAAGGCVQCVTDKDCAGPTDDCQHPACMGASCGVAFTAAGIATVGNPVQIPGDCHKLVCLGAVVNMVDYQAVVDDADAPASGTVCVTDTCSGGSVVPTIHSGIMCGTDHDADDVQHDGPVRLPEQLPSCPLPDTCGGGAMPNVCEGCTPGATCANLGKTCGGPFPDGCFSTLPCNDGVKDGTETDVDCGGSATTCATRCAQGKKCAAGSDCQSGFCADGVCCNVACTGSTCQACSAAAKGQGADGLCGAVFLGQDPHGDCPMEAASTCGRSGGCNGSGACSKYPSGTVCQGGSCAGAVLTKAETCSGGVCTAPSPTTQDCAPFQCTGGACSNGSCATDADCASTAYCKAGTCAPRMTTGTGCTAGDQCLSGFCTDGVCCNVACTGTPCMACFNTGAANGTCSAAKNGADPRMLCPTTASTSCGTDGKCKSGVCEDWPGGTTCSASSRAAARR